MNMSNPPSVDPKDPRIRYTAADVMMKFVHDLPTYFGLSVVLVMATTHLIDGIHAVGGIAFIYQARSRPPDPDDKLGKITRGLSIGVIALILASGVISACR